MESKIDEKEALIRAYDELIRDTERQLEEQIKTYNKRIVRKAYEEIDKDLKEHRCDLGLNILHNNELTGLKSNIDLFEARLKALKESKERMTT